MKKKLLGMTLILGLGLALASCSSDTKPEEKGEDATQETGENQNEGQNGNENQGNENQGNNGGQNQTKTGTYTIKVYDIDDELIGNETISIEDYPVFADGLNAKFDAKIIDSAWGPSLVSINGSVIDANWYLASYENGEYATTGIDGLVVDDGDVFEFRNTCWNTYPHEDGSYHLDDYDVLVDKAIYHYAKTYLKEALASSNSYTGSKYWEDMTIYAMTSNGYDQRLFDGNLHNDAFKDSVKNVDVSTLSGANIGKWFYAARVLGLNLETFRSNYKTKLEALTSFNAFSTPFIISGAKYLELEDSIPSSVINTTSRGSGDGLCWQLASLALFKDFDNSELDPLTIADGGNATSLALKLLPYAAFNQNVRNKKGTDGKDIIELLFDNYYDSEKMLVKVYKNDETVNMSTNQVYASLVAYKIQRDSDHKKAVSIFA